MVVPEIADYEVRRELIRAGKTRGLTRLDAPARKMWYFPITTDAMPLAAKCWTQARKERRPTAADPAPDADMILAAQAAGLDNDDNDMVIATTNVGHLSRFATTALWTDIAAHPGAQNGAELSGSDDD